MKKKLTLFIVVLLLITGFWVVLLTKTGFLKTRATALQNSGAWKDSPQDAVDDSQKKEITATVSAFFNEYLDCIKNPPVDAKDKTYTYCHENNALITSDFSKSLEFSGTASGEADPVTCAQTPPEAVKVSNVTSFNTTARADVTVTDTKRTHIAKVDLNRLEGGWKVNNVLCQK